MARKQALRDLQMRLAERLLAARTQRRGRAWLAVECAGQGFLVPLEDAGEIFAATAPVPLPYAQPWCLGVANLRGQLHTVVDLGAFLGLPAARRSGATREQAQLVAFNPTLEINAALLVDRLAGLRREEQMAALQPAGEAADMPVAADVRPAFAGARLRDAEGRVWQELKLAALARHEAFLRVGA